MLFNIFLQILNISFTGGIVITFVLLARLFLKRVPKIFSYALWSVVLFRLICPFSFESVFSLLPTKTNPITEDIIYMQTPAIDTGAAIINNSVNALLPAATPYASINPLQIYLYIGSVVWVTGIVILLVYSLVTLLQLKIRLKTATLYEKNIFLSDRTDTAFVLGVLRPRIYLPSNLSDEQRVYILLHEQTHIKRFDHLIKLLSFLVLCLHWFNPLAWIAFFTSGRDMEMSCDESVVKQLGNDIKKDYSTSLLTLAAGRRMAGCTPPAFGEGDTKGRIKNVLTYRKPSFWTALIAAAAVICIIAGLMSNPKDKGNGFAGVNAVIIEIDKNTQTMIVEGVDENSVIGDRCIVSWEKNALLTVATNSKPMQLTIDDFAVGDFVVLYIGEVQETYPARTTASSIELQPDETQLPVYSAEALWNARTPYAGDAPAVGKLIGLLPVPAGLQYDHFQLHTSEPSYDIEIFYTADDSVFAHYDSSENEAADPFWRNALILLALVDNSDGIRATITNGSQSINFINMRSWAEETVGGDVRQFAENVSTLKELLSMPASDVPDPGSTGTSKPITPVDYAAASYSFERHGKDGEIIAVAALTDEALAEAIIMDAVIKSAAWEGVDISTLEEYYLIRQIFPDTQEIHDYYAYRLENGTAVLQSGLQGHYSIISDELYDKLDGIYTGAVERLPID